MTLCAYQSFHAQRPISHGTYRATRCIRDSKWIAKVTPIRRLEYTGHSVLMAPVGALLQAPCLYLNVFSFCMFVCRTPSTPAA